MARLSINIPEELRAKLAERAPEHGDASVEQYVERLLRQEGAAASDDDRGGPADLTAASREHLGAMLQEALQTPAREMTSADWDEMKRRLLDQSREGMGG